jgi:hypothetical protein
VRHGLMGLEASRPPRSSSCPLCSVHLHWYGLAGVHMMVVAVVHGIRFLEMPEKLASALPLSAPKAVPLVPAVAEQEMAAAAASSSAFDAASGCWAGSSPQSPENNGSCYRIF